jgi:hypothetical protein
MLGGILVETPDDFESSREAGWPSGSGCGDVERHEAP